jgi:hypothetical protein
MARNEDLLVELLTTRSPLEISSGDEAKPLHFSSKIGEERILSSAFFGDARGSEECIAYCGASSIVDEPVTFHQAIEWGVGCKDSPQTSAAFLAVLSAIIV